MGHPVLKQWHNWVNRKGGREEVMLRGDWPGGMPILLIALAIALRQGILALKLTNSRSLAL